MSDQEVIVAEEIEAKVEEPALEASESAAEVETKTEDSQDSDVSSATQAEEEVAGSVSSDESGLSAEVTDQAEEEVAGPVSSDESVSATETTEEASEALSILSLQKGQHLTGVVKNITNFGAFIDLGIAQDGLVHISELARRKVDSVSEVVSQGQEVDVWVKKVDKKRGRISLTMIRPVTLKLKDIEEDAELDGMITRLESYGAFVDIGSERDGLVHISQITHEYIKHPADVLSPGDPVSVKVLKVNRKKRQIDLSIKALLPEPEPEVRAEPEPVYEPVKEPQFQPTVEEESGEPMPTAMAIAYAALQGESQADKSRSAARDKKKAKKDMDDIVQRTLANREK